MIRKRAEDFLELVERAKRGRLKVYIGFAAGVGKTYRMLQEAHSLKNRGVDVVLGFIETHKRKETEELIKDLEMVPLKIIEYRGVSVGEMDLEGVIQRRPQVAVVDEVAHTNAPGSKNKKRYQDILDLLDAGINVICAFNIQHLESLNEIVEKSSGVVVRETIPDSFLHQADQVVNLDLAVEDLLERLQSGRIYHSEKVAWAMENFFKQGNLSALRELALREVAESLDRSAAAKSKLDEASIRMVNPNRKIMVCMASFSPHAVPLLRRGSKMAGKLNTDWYVVYVQTPRESPQKIDATTQRHLLDNIQKAKDLGAEVVQLKSKEPVAAVLEFAKTHSVGDIVLGRSERSYFQQLLGRSFMHQMVRKALGFDLHIIAPQQDEEENS